MFYLCIMKTILTWIKPTADQIHIWNYFGALKQVLEYQKDSDKKLILFIADLHSLNVIHSKWAIGQYTIKQAKIYLACWLDVTKTLFFRQSKVPAHTQLNWVLAAITNLGYMKRMHAYKDAVAKWKQDEITMGTFNYPILMAADILLYDPDLVPVGKDQKQHLEFTRDIAQKFNRLFWETFKVPQPYIQTEVATVKWIDWRKMSKSYNNYIWLLDDEQTILKKVRSIITDNKPIEEPKNPDECNIYSILKLFLSEKEDKTVRKWYTQWWKPYKDIKMFLYEKILSFVKPIQQKYSQISDEEVVNILEKWETRANQIANKKIKQIFENIWL